MSGAHNWNGLTPWGLRYCLKCGLGWLNNLVTRKAIKKPCPGAEDDA